MYLGCFFRVASKAKCCVVEHAGAGEVVERYISYALRGKCVISVN